MEVEPCMKGFSYMPKKKIEFIDLKYVEKDELEQTWKTSRRQRLKQQEQRIWDQFVQEQDIVSNIYKDDPYQFLHQLPESCIKELLEEELRKMRSEQSEENVQQQQAEINRPPTTDTNNQHVVTFIEEQDREDMFHIFDDEKDDEVSGPEEEVLNESGGSPPCTVRERDNRSPIKSISPDKASSKSSENVTSMIETSIYCAKVKDLRIKINEELLDVIGTLERQDLNKIEPEEAGKLLKRSSEFCARFNRIYLYQLHRQVHEVSRGAGAALPFARHTQFQSQMVRVVSLHQNLLNTTQVFHKAIPHTACARDTGEALRTLLRTVLEAGAACRDSVSASAPSAARHLYADEIELTCGKLEDCLNEYTDKLTEYLDNLGHAGKSRKGKNKGRKRSLGAWSKSGTKSGADTEGRLSMYSLDTLRLNLNSKSSISKGHSSGTSKVRGGLTGGVGEVGEAARSQRKSPKGRRPLMRDPAAGKPRRKQHRDLDVATLVEAVGACASSHISREDSPHASAAPAPRRRRRRSARARAVADRPLQDAKPETKDDGGPEENVDGPTPGMPEMKVELKPKSPEKIIESTLRAAREHADSARSARQDVTTNPTVTRPVRGGAGGCPEHVSGVERCKQDGNTDSRRSDRDRHKVMEVLGSCEVSRLLRQLCGGDSIGGRNEKVSGVKNAQLLCVNSCGSPRQPSTPQLLRILEETIQKKVPKPLCPKPITSVRDAEKLRLAFNIPEKTTENLFQYRTKFVQHMLTSSMYANSAVGKPWEMIGSISDQIIDELLLGCAKEMELRDIVQELYASETQ